MTADPVRPEINRPLEMDGNEFREVLDAVAPRLAEFINSLQQGPAWAETDIPGNAARFREPLPETGGSLPPLLQSVIDDVVAQGFNTASPGYLAYIPGGGLPMAAVADLIAGVINRYVTVWQAAPVAAEIEATVIRWICEMVGYPPETSGGFLTTGGSLASWSAVVTARRTLLPENFLQGTIYTSDQTHHSVAKAAMLAGFPEKNVRTVPCDGSLRVDPDRMETLIEQDRREGFTPFLIVGNAGTTNTGAVDDLNRLADLAERNGMWLHVDAAYGGFFMLTDRGREALAGLARADSITLDPHKGLFLPFGTGTLVVREQSRLEAAHRLDADYLPPMQENGDCMDLCRISPELSREFRGLRLWLPIKVYGIAAFRRELDEKWDLAHRAAETLRDLPAIDIVAEPQLSLFAFRLKPHDLDNGEKLNDLNRRFLEAVNEHRRVMLTGTMLGGRFVLRICVLSFRTHADRLDDCLTAIERAVKQLLGPR